MLFVISKRSFHSSGSCFGQDDSHLIGGCRLFGFWPLSDEGSRYFEEGTKFSVGVGGIDLIGADLMCCAEEVAVFLQCFGQPG